jgi:hypothetical protein
MRRGGGTIGWSERFLSGSVHCCGPHLLGRKTCHSQSLETGLNRTRRRLGAPSHSGGRSHRGPKPLGVPSHHGLHHSQAPNSNGAPNRNGARRSGARRSIPGNRGVPPSILAGRQVVRRMASRTTSLPRNPGSCPCGPSCSVKSWMAPSRLSAGMPKPCSGPLLLSKPSLAR